MEPIFKKAVPQAYTYIVTKNIRFSNVLIYDPFSLTCRSDHIPHQSQQNKHSWSSLLELERNRCSPYDWGIRLDTLDFLVNCLPPSRILLNKR